MSDESRNETGITATPVSIRKRRFPLKTAVAVAVWVVLLGHTSQAIKNRLEAGGTGTILPARIRAARVFSVVAEQPGTVHSISAAAGDSVQPGQKLATLDDPELALALERAKTRLARAEERKQAVAHGDSTIKIFAEQYSAADAASKTACSRAKEFGSAAMEGRYYEDSRARTKAVEKLVADGLATAAELERIRESEENALRALAEAREERSRLQQECDSSLSQVRVARLQRDLTRRSDAESAEAEYTDALAQVKTLSQQSQRLHIIAPRAGTVLSAQVVAGDPVTAGAVLFQIGDLSELSVEVPVGGRIAREIRKGEKVLVRLPMDPPREIEAPVSSVVLAPGPDAQSYVVRVRIPNPDSRVILAGLESAVVFRHSRNSE